MLRGRTAECDGLVSLLQDVRTARSRTLVLRGEAGVGKTALLDFVGEQARGCQVLRASGLELEMELAFAGLHQLCAPLMDRVEHLPAPQRESLEVAFGLRIGEPPERLMIGLAVLSLLAGVAEQRPVVCLVDDAQWLDRASTQALTFVARRLLAESVGLVFTVREPNDDPAWSELTSQAVEGLNDEDARTLLTSAVPGLLDERVRARIIGESRGNPLALLELYRAMTPADLAGARGTSDGRSVARRIEQSFQRRLDALSPDTQRSLLLAAAEPLGDAALLWRGIGELGLDPRAIVSAQEAELIDVGVVVRFRHPLVRSMVYRGASSEARQQVHATLARLTDPIADPDRQAWHRALAAAGFDDEVADDLERSAGRARARGGTAAAAAFLERALELTSDPDRRASRALAAAELQLESGALERSSELLAAADMAPHDALQGARREHLRARILFVRQRGRDAPLVLLRAAQQLEQLDPARAREVYLDAFLAAATAGKLSVGCTPVDVAEAARAAPPVDAPAPRAVDLLFDAWVVRYTDGYAAAVPAFHRALRALRDLDDAEALRWMVLELGLASDLWMDETLSERSSRHLTTARGLGALSTLPLAIGLRIAALSNAGEFPQAAVLHEEALAISHATGTAPVSGPDVLLIAWRGDEAVALPMIDEILRDAAARGDADTAAIAQYAAAVLYAGLGRYDQAFEALRVPCEHEGLGLRVHALSELVEAATRTGHAAVADDAAASLRERAVPAGTDWALGMQARAQAFLSEGADADDLFRASVDRLGRSRAVVHLARSHLAYGEWLRRENRRVDARAQLRAAHELFERIGANAFVERARRELVATGETVRKRTDDTRQHLTAQERQIAELASDGLSNPEIAALLFLSARTVEWHLRKVFTKLAIKSRRELREATRTW